MEIIVDVHQQLYDKLTKIAESYKLSVEQWLEDHLEDEYG